MPSSSHAGAPSPSSNAGEWEKEFRQKYEVQSGASKLGRGTFGEVLAARCREGDSACAVKRVWRKSYEGEGEDIQRELSISTTLPRHPNVVSVFAAYGRPDVEQATIGEDVAFLVMELCVHSLQKELKRLRGQATLREEHCVHVPHDHCT